MAANLGIDFGSTYTMMSSYDDINDTVTGVQTENGSIYIPSVACLQRNRLIVGTQARNQMMYDPTLQFFRAFKMLLHEQKEDALSKHGYFGTYTPRLVAAEFLKKYVLIAAKKCSVKQFDHAVITVPAHWAESYSRMSGRAVLLDICKGFKNDGQELLKSIKVVTEPVAASAFYAHNYYKKHKNTPFEGNIIVIDYGGGTLDITLTEVNAKSSTNATNAMEINALWSTGSGENHPDRIGDAGLAYMEKVTAMALAKAGFPNAPIDGNFLQVKDTLEAELMERTDELADWIDINCGRRLEKMGKNESEFTVATYGDKDISISYGVLYQAFEAFIKPVLMENLQELKQELDAKKIDPLKDMAKIKLAVVGGFGQFPLVQKTVWQFFGYTGDDMDITNGAEGGKQDAISFGAALIAGNAVSVRVTSKYSIGLRITRGGRESYDYAICCGDEIKDFSRVYPLGGRWYPIVYRGSTDPEKIPWVFATNKSRDAKKAKARGKGEFAYRMIPCEAVCRELRSAAPGGTYYFGFSMDESEIYTLYIFPEDPETGTRIEEPIKVKTLGNFNDIFGDNVAFDPEDEKNLIYK